MSKICCKECDSEIVSYNPTLEDGTLAKRTGNWIAVNCTKCNVVTTLFDTIHSKTKGGLGS